MQEALNPGTRVSCLALLYPSSLCKSQTSLASKTGDQERKGLHTHACTRRFIPQEMAGRLVTMPTTVYPRQKGQGEKKIQFERLLLPPRQATSGLGAQPFHTYHVWDAEDPMSLPWPCLPVPREQAILEPVLVVGAKTNLEGRRKGG
jgi:hypothetical protein